MKLRQRRGRTERTAGEGEGRERGLAKPRSGSAGAAASREGAVGQTRSDRILDRI